MKTIWIIHIFVFLLAAGGALAQDRVDLTGDVGHLEYRAEDFGQFSVGRPENPLFGPPGLLYDVDGDGYQDYIRSNYGYICAVGYNGENPVTYYQINLPPEYCRESGPSFGLAGNIDLDGDGLTEVVAVGHTEDHMRWGFWIMDPREGKILTSFELEGGPETRLDGIWDGNYRVAGMVRCQIEGAQRTGLVLSVNIGFDLEGRGVMAVDPWTGDILWRFVTGPNPLGYATKVVDLDHDGQAEVVVCGRAPDNLGGKKINGFSDDESRLFVLDNQGELLWTEHLGGWYGGSYLVTADLDGDGLEEIITSTQTTPEVWGEIVVWSHDGKALVRHTAQDQFHDMALIPAPDSGNPNLAVTSTSGVLRIFAITPPGLELTASVDFGTLHYINCLADILPPDGSELVISTIEGDSWVLGGDFHPLARFQIPRKAWKQAMMPWRPKPDLELLMHEYGPGYPLVFSRIPPAPAHIARVVGAVVLVILGGAVVFLWKRKTTRRNEDPAALREVRLNLLEDLELSNHGAIAPLKCLRRLIWHMNAMTSGLGDNESIEVRLRENWTESLENALPHLAGILDRARLAGLAGANVDYAAGALARVRQELEQMEACGFTTDQFERIVPVLTTETAKADDALKDLRKEVAGYFQADPADTVTRVLRANAMSLEENGITIQTGFLARMAAGGGDYSAGMASPALTCLIDPVELDFVLDNLVGNAIRAMDESDPRNLSITWSTADGMVTLDVRDTGRGIPDEHRDRIMTTQFSTRDGGGKGLPVSRRILRKYGGSLMVLDTAVGHGTTFRVTLPTV